MIRAVDAGAFDPSDGFGVFGDVFGESYGGLLSHAIMISRYRDAAPRCCCVGAKLGAIPCGRRWTVADAGGLESSSFRATLTPVDICGHGSEISGSETWGFEPVRACCAKPLVDVGLRALRQRMRHAVGAILVSRPL